MTEPESPIERRIAAMLTVLFESAEADADGRYTVSGTRAHWHDRLRAGLDAADAVDPIHLLVTRLRAR